MATRFDDPRLLKILLLPNSIDPVLTLDVNEGGAVHDGAACIDDVGHLLLVLLAEVPTLQLQIPLSPSRSLLRVHTVQFGSVLTRTINRIVPIGSNYNGTKPNRTMYVLKTEPSKSRSVWFSIFNLNIYKNMIQQYNFLIISDTMQHPNVAKSWDQEISILTTV